MNVYRESASAIASTIAAECIASGRWIAVVALSAGRNISVCAYPLVEGALTAVAIIMAGVFAFVEGFIAGVAIMLASMFASVFGTASDVLADATAASRWCKDLGLTVWQAASLAFWWNAKSPALVAQSHVRTPWWRRNRYVEEFLADALDDQAEGVPWWRQVSYWARVVFCSAPALVVTVLLRPRQIRD